MKKCLGCGEVLQNYSRLLKGYAYDLSKDYCERCFRLKHYNDLTLDLRSDIKRDEVFELLKDLKEVTYVLILDVLNIEASLKQDLINFLKKKRLIIIISKCDLLPKMINFNKFEYNLLKYLKEVFVDADVIEVIMSSKNDYNFKSLFEKVADSDFNHNFCFIGNSNAGKSSLINKLLDDDKLTTSYFLTTTLSLNYIDFNNFALIDTPGLVDEDNIYMHLENNDLKKILIKKSIKPKIYQLYENQSYFIGYFVRINAYTNTNSSIIFYVNNDLYLHRTKLSRGDDYQKNHFNGKIFNEDELGKKVFNLNKEHFEVVIDGLGFIGVNNIDKLEIITNKSVSIFKRKGIM